MCALMCACVSYNFTQVRMLNSRDKLLLYSSILILIYLDQRT